MSSGAFFLSLGSPEWCAAWAVLRAAEGDTVAENPASGEVWQYMGTENQGGGWEHVFRHRDHPTTGRREYRRVRASTCWAPDREPTDTVN